MRGGTGKDAKTIRQKRRYDDKTTIAAFLSYRHVRLIGLSQNRVSGSFNVRLRSGRPGKTRAEPTTAVIGRRPGPSRDKSAFYQGGFYSDY
eukprot:3064958-Amphidinium_carterae.1